MTQCAGTTMKGERCRREAREGSSYCSIHFEQVPRPSPEPGPAAASEPAASREVPPDAQWMMKAAVGLAVVAVIVLLRRR